MAVLISEKEGTKQANKEDAANLKNAQQKINDLVNEINKVESSEEQQKEKFKKQLDSLIPKLNLEVQSLHEESIEPQYLDENSDINDMIKQLDAKWEKYVELQTRSEKYNIWQEKLETSQTQFQNVQDLYDQLYYRRLLWRSKDEWQKLKAGYENTPFGEINDKEISKQCDKYGKISGQLERQLESNPIQENLKELVEEFRGAMPIVSALRNKDLKADHWRQINEFIEGEINIDDENFKLQDLIDLKIVQFQDEIVAISARATGEAKLQVDFDAISQAW